jgi:ribonuclease D
MDNHTEINKNEPYIFIKDRAGVLRAAEILSSAKVIGVDLESDSMFHYKEKVCLIQISIPNYNLLIDALSVKDLQPLLPIFANHDIRKVFHGADYDVRSLFRDFKIEINALFDTQIAARFLGIQQTGLSFSLEDRFNICLEKKYQKSDWSRRPLTTEMLQYAVRDTCYLIDLSVILEKELREKGRFSWFEEECQLLSKVRPSLTRDEPLFLRFKGASRLDQRGLAVLNEILKWREESALKRDVPPFKILGNEQILDITNKKPLDMEGLEGLSVKQIHSLGRPILKMVQAAMVIPEDSLPLFPKEKRSKPGAMTLKKINALKKWRDRYGKKIGLDPSIICTNSLIQLIVECNPSSLDDLKALGEMRRWQIDLFGKEILDLLSSINNLENSD